jgi:hypothetical protein
MRRTPAPASRGERGGSIRRIGAAGCAAFLVAAVGFVAGRAAGTTVPAQAQPSPMAVPNHIQGSAPSAAVSFVAGVPARYTDDRAGAVEAATALCRTLGGPLLLNPTAYVQAVRAIAVPGQEATLAQAASQQLSALDETYHLISLAAQGVPVSVTTVPISYELDAFTAARATVAIWAVGVMAAAGHISPTAVWTTFQYHLTWSSEWRLQSISTLDAGWAPADIQPTPATSDIPGQLGDYRRYPDAPS